MALYILSGVAIGLLVVTLALGLLYSLDWGAVFGHLIPLLMMLGVLYWATTLLPGPVKKVGKAAGRQIVKSMKKRNHE